VADPEYYRISDTRILYIFVDAYGRGVWLTLASACSLLRTFPETAMTRGARCSVSGTCAAAFLPYQLPRCGNDWTAVTARRPLLLHTGLDPAFWIQTMPVSDGRPTHRRQLAAPAPDPSASGKSDSASQHCAPLLAADRLRFISIVNDYGHRHSCSTTTAISTRGYPHLRFLLFRT
jgi:hypothetical protein